MTTAELFTIIGVLIGVGAAVLGVVYYLFNQLNRAVSEQKADMNRQFTELRDEMNRQFSEQKADTNRQFGELRDEMNRRFDEQSARMDRQDARMDRQDARMDRMEAQHGELVGEMHRMSKRLGRIDMMLELLTQRRPSVRQMFRRRAADAA